MFRKQGCAGWQVPLGGAFVCAMLAWAPFTPLSGAEIMTTVAGGGTQHPNDQLATDAALISPRSVAVDAAGNTYVADKAQVTLVDKATGKINTVAGNGVAGDYAPDGVSATGALLGATLSIALDGQGNLYIADIDNSKILKVTGGTVTRVGGNEADGFSGDGGLATSARINVTGGFAVSSNGNIFLASDTRIRRIDASTNIITTFAGTGAIGQSGDGGPALQATLGGITSLAVDGLGNVYVAQFQSQDVDKSGNPIVDVFQRVRAITSNGNAYVISTVAGNGSTGTSGDGGPATSAGLSSPAAVAVGGSFDDPSEKNRFLYIGDAARIRMVDLSSGIITKVAGNGSLASYGDGGLASIASLDVPVSISINSNGEATFADIHNNRVRKAGFGLGSGDLTDADADGFPDYVETAAATNPLDYTSTPFGNQPVTIVRAFAVIRLDLKVTFTARSRYNITMTGFVMGLSSNSNVVPGGTRLILDFGDSGGHITTVFKVDQHGRGVSGKNRLLLRKAIVSGVLPFRAVLSGDYAGEFEEFGFVNDTIFISRNLTLPMAVYWPCTATGVVYPANLPVLYYAKKDRFGKSAH